MHVASRIGAAERAVALNPEPPSAVAGARAAVGGAASADEQMARDRGEPTADPAPAGSESARHRLALRALGRALGALPEPAAGLRTLLAHVVPALAPTAVVVLLGDDHAITHAAASCSLPGDGMRELEIAPATLPAAHLALLRTALAAAGPESAGGPSLADGALRILALHHGGRCLGALWVDGECTPLGEALLEDVAERAATALALAGQQAELRVRASACRHAQARLEESRRRQDEFLAMLSHELRNPLAPLRNAVEVLRLLAPPGRELCRAVDVTERQVLQLTRLVDELLDVARINQGKIELRPQVVELGPLVAQCVEAHRATAVARRQALALALPESPLVLHGDPARIAQIVDNLLCNASQYTQEGGSIDVRVARGVDESGAELAAIEVSDDGMGMEAELLPHVFELFEQGKRALDRSQGGLGVGLTLVQRLARLHAGDVDASSRGAGLGSCFRVRLPCLPVDAAPPRGSSAAMPAAATVAGRRILVVDDNLDVVETTMMLLTLSGHDVRSASDGREALRQAAQFRPDVVLLDIGLPLMDGYEVARRLREMAATRAALLIALTGYGQQGDRERGKDAGFDAHMLKPVDPRALAALIAG